MNRDIQAKVTKTAAFVGADVDISDLTGDFTIHLKVHKLTGEDAVALFGIVDTVDNFTASKTVRTQDTKGKIDPDGKQGGQHYSWRKRDLKSLRAGVTGAELRLNLVSLTGTAPSVDYEAWITYNN